MTTLTDQTIHNNIDRDYIYMVYTYIVLFLLLQHYEVKVHQTNTTISKK